MISLSLLPSALALVCGAVLVAAILRGFTGFGFALAAVPILSFAMPPSRSVALVILLQALVGTRDVVRLRRVVHRPSLGWLMLGALFGTPIGLLLLARLDPSTVRLLIAGIVCLAIVFLARKPAFHAHAGARLALPTGFLAGLFGGVAAMPGPPAIAYYLSVSTPPNVARASLMVFFFSTSLIALPGLFLARLIDVPTVVLSLVALPVLLAGTALGGWLFSRSGSAFYRPVALTVLIIMAVATGIRGGMDLFG